MTFSRWTLSAILGAMLAACGGGGGGGAEEAHEADPQYAGDIQSSDTARGAEIYANVCGACHDSGAPQIANLSWDPARMRQQVREGEGRMPAISEARVSAEDLEALLAHLTTIGAVVGATPAAGGDEGAGGEAPEVPSEGDEAPAEG